MKFRINPEDKNPENKYNIFTNGIFIKVLNFFLVVIVYIKIFDEIFLTYRITKGTKKYIPNESKYTTKTSNNLL